MFSTKGEIGYVTPRIRKEVKFQNWDLKVPYKRANHVPWFDPQTIGVAVGRQLQVLSKQGPQRDLWTVD